MNSVFAYTDYKAYLSEWIEKRAASPRGERSRIAVALKCHVAYVSRVLNGDADLSLEQGQALNRYLGHSPDESDFFLLLVLHARASTPDLREHFRVKIQADADRKQLLKNRLNYEKSLSEGNQVRYFSAWYYAAIHLLLAVPEMRSPKALARRLRLSPKRVSEVLQFLVGSGLAVERNGSYQTGPVSIHLGSDSPMISKHHANWRVQAIQSLERDRTDELHYSSVITLAEKHVPEVRKLLVAAVEQVRSLVKASPEEKLYCYSMDLFEVARDTGQPE